MIKKNMTLKKNEIHLYLVLSYKTYKECLMQTPALSYFMTDHNSPVTTKGVLEIYDQKIISFFFRKLSLGKWKDCIEKLQKTLEGKEYELAIIHADGTTEHSATFPDEPNFLNLQITFESKYKFQKVA